MSHKLTQLSPRSHPRHLLGKGTAQKDTIIDTTSDSQVNNNFPYRWSRASLTLNNYFYLFLYLYMTIITINNNAPHLKSPKNQNRRDALGRPAMKLLGVGGFSQFMVDQPSPLVLPWFLRPLVVWFSWKIPSSSHRRHFDVMCPLGFLISQRGAVVEWLEQLGYGAESRRIA